MEDNFKKELIEKFKEKFSEEDIVTGLETYIKAYMRKSILDKSTRIDGRCFTDIRPLSAEVGLLPRTHGSGLFNRGETQVMTIVTLGPMSERQQLDGLGVEETKTLYASL